MSVEDTLWLVWGVLVICYFAMAVATSGGDGGAQC